VLDDELHIAQELSVLLSMTLLALPWDRGSDPAGVTSIFTLMPTMVLMRWASV
jgi:hypothetical protein